MPNFSSNKDIFMAISAVLTGHPLEALMETGKADSHFQILATRNAPWNLALFFEASSILLECYENDPDKLQKVAKHQLVAQSQFNGLGNKLCMLWETGSWPDSH